MCEISNVRLDKPTAHDHDGHALLFCQGESIKKEGTHNEHPKEY